MSSQTKLMACPQCTGDVVATPMTRTAPDGKRELWAWACPLHGGPLPLH